MRITMNNEQDLIISEFTSPGINISSADTNTQYSALQMFATSMAICTYSVLTSYAEQLDISSDNISIHMHWSYVAAPFRIKHIDVDVKWPELPASRQEAAGRAAAHCTIHNTLAHPPKVVTRVNSEPTF